MTGWIGSSSQKKCDDARPPHAPQRRQPESDLLAESVGRRTRPVGGVAPAHHTLVAGGGDAGVSGRRLRPRVVVVDRKATAVGPASKTRTHARTPTCTHARTHARKHARTHTHTHARTHARTHAPTHARTHAHTHAHAQEVVPRTPRLARNQVKQLGDEQPPTQHARQTRSRQDRWTTRKTKKRACCWKPPLASAASCRSRPACRKSSCPARSSPAAGARGQAQGTGEGTTVEWLM